MNNIKQLQNNLGYIFNNSALFEEALTHRSKHKTKNNERLEFLGDSVLNLIISIAIYEQHPTAREGELSRLRAALVKGETIAKIATELGIGESLRLGAGELKSGGSYRESILAGAFEAVVGAIFCDADFQTAKSCVLKWYGYLLSDIDAMTDVKDAKTTLQEWLQARQLSLPVYTCKISGEAHAQQFTVTCRAQGFVFETEGVSTNRRKAEQIAAKQFLTKLLT